MHKKIHENKFRENLREILIIYIISKVTKYYHEVPLLKVFIKYQVSL